jgi:hypothetical protein
MRTIRYDGGVRSALLILLLGGCGDGDSASCRLDPLARADVSQQTAVDCGSFSLDADGGFADATMKAAHDCVLDAVSRSQAFTLFYDVWDAYRHLRGGFSGSVDGSGKLHTKSYAYVGDSKGGSFDPRPILTAESCGTVAATPSCTPVAGIPCLSCVNPGTATTLCRF